MVASAREGARLLINVAPGNDSHLLVKYSKHTSRFICIPAILSIAS